MATINSQSHPGQAIVQRRALLVLDRPLVMAIMLSAVVGACALYWFYIHDLVLIYSDAVTHLNIARRILDSRTPGIAQFGTVWLPVPHLLMQPFIYSDFLWQSGLAGSFVGYACFTVTAASLFQLVRLITDSKISPWVGLAVFLLNPNALYIHTTALTEPILLASMSCSAYYLYKWSDRFTYQHIIMAGLLAMVAVGSRYDGWAFALASAALILCASYCATQDPQRAEGSTLAYLVLPAYAMMMWFFYNWLIFGDPLEFSRGEYSAAFQQEMLAKAGQLLTKDNWLLSTITYSWAVLDNLGGVTTSLAVAGLLSHLAAIRFRPQAIVLYALLSAYPFNILSLWMGQTAIGTLHSAPPGLFNIRYGIMMLPGAVVFLSYLADRIIRQLQSKPASLTIPILLFVQTLCWLPGWPTSVITIADGLGGASARAGRLQAADFLRQRYEGGGILIDDTNPQFIFEAGIHMNEYIGTFTYDLWPRALHNPAEHVEWVVLNPGSEGDRVTNGINMSELKARFRVEFKDGGLELYRRQ